MKTIIMIETAKKAEQKLKNELNFTNQVMLKEVIRGFNKGEHIELNSSYYSVNQ